MVLACVVAIAASSQAVAVEMDFSGMIRFRPEFRNNDDFNSNADDYVDAVSQRMLLNLKATIDPKLEVGVGLQDTRVWGQTCNACTSVNDYDPDGGPGDAMGGETGVARNPLASDSGTDLYELWFLAKDFAGLPMNLKMGRQQLAYGDQRLIGNLGWKDQARTFDAFKTEWLVGDHKIDLFWSKINETEEVNLRGLTPKDFQTSKKKDENLYGVYAVFALGGDPWKNALDLYYLGWEEGNTELNVQTYGFRLNGGVAGIDYTGEFVWQGGDWAKGVAQEANALAVKAGYTIASFWKTRIGAEYDFGSGDDDPANGAHKTFVFPFHTNHAFYGLQDFFSWGNMRAIGASLKTVPVDGPVTVQVDYWKFELAEAHDQWLTVVGTAPRVHVNANPSDSTDAGQEWDLTVTYGYSPNLKLSGGYSLFFPGTAAKERSGGSDNAEWGYLMTLLTF
ncbi:MAG: alginate export family protein [Nitrospinae bacterium]|nr:alginate export family protein [Nitrospinota bacterium]